MKYLNTYESFDFEEDFEEEELSHNITHVPPYLKSEIYKIQKYLNKLIKKSKNKRFSCSVDRFDEYLYGENRWSDSEIGIARVFYSKDKYSFRIGIKKRTSKEFNYWINGLIKDLSEIPFVKNKMSRTKSNYANEIVISFDEKDELMDFLEGCGFDTGGIVFGCRNYLQPKSGGNVYENFDFNEDNWDEEEVMDKRDIIILDIKNKIKKYGHQTTMDLRADYSPGYHDTDTEIHLIERFHYNDVEVIVYGGYKFQDVTGEYDVVYEELELETLGEIKEIIDDAIENEIIEFNI